MFSDWFLSESNSQQSRHNLWVLLNYWTPWGTLHSTLNVREVSSSGFFAVRYLWFIKKKNFFTFISHYSIKNFTEFIFVMIPSNEVKNRITFEECQDQSYKIRGRVNIIYIELRYSNGNFNHIMVNLTSLAI